MTRKRTPIRRWSAHLWHESTRERLRPILPAVARPEPASWSDTTLTAAWLGHATVLVNFCGLWVVTDPALFPRIGIRFPAFTLGPKRHTAAALTTRELPPLDLVLLSHAHFDHLDTRTLRQIRGRPDAIAASRTGDLLRAMPFEKVTELRWGEATTVERAGGELHVRAFQVRHWGARLRHDFHRGYNGYVLERNGRRVIFGGDTAMTDTFAGLRGQRAFDLAIMGIGAYDPWIGSHANPEQAIAMATAAGAEHILPLHHQTFRLSAEPFREPIERFEAALAREPERIALREIGETFTLPA
jgi:L-ascorbate metabolism protein UlaG (beta-lactamase superfamily)